MSVEACPQPIRKLGEVRYEMEWVHLQEFPNYKVSNYGDVMNIDRGTYLSPIKTQGGFLTYALHKEGTRTWVLAHRLVASIWMEEYFEGMHIRHLDGDKTNNHFLNLAPKAQQRDLRASLVGFGGNGRRVRIIETGEVFRNVYSMARFINGDPSNIYHVLNGRLKTHRGYSYEWVDDQ